METLKISIANIKNIRSASFEFPIEKSLNLIVGSNGSGKSTALLALSQAVSKFSLRTLKNGDFDNTSVVEICLGGKQDVWSGANSWNLPRRNIILNGMYEGSLFYGT